MKNTTTPRENASDAPRISLWHEHIIRADASLWDDSGLSLEMTVGRSGGDQTVSLSVEWYGEIGAELVVKKIPVLGLLPMKSGAALEAYLTPDQFRAFAVAFQKLADSLEYAESTLTPPHIAIGRKAS